MSDMKRDKHFDLRVSDDELEIIKERGGADYVREQALAASPAKPEAPDIKGMDDWIAIGRHVDELYGLDGLLDQLAAKLGKEKKARWALRVVTALTGATEFTVPQEPPTGPLARFSGWIVHGQAYSESDTCMVYVIQHPKKEQYQRFLEDSPEFEALNGKLPGDVI